MYISEVEGKGGISAKVVADSIANEVRLVTMELRYPRFIHSEFMTHRVFSRNASSSRAIPIDKMINQVMWDTARPVEWGLNQPGMQAEDVITDRDKVKGYEYDWISAAREAAFYAGVMNGQGLHKQIVNRILEPYQFIKVIVTSTEWDNFFNLRLDKAAQPEIQELANCMKSAMDISNPEELNENQYHLPYLSRDTKYADKVEYGDDLIKMSVARCARVSYLNHDNSEPNVDKDVKLHDMLLNMGHMSPFEHIATPMTDEIACNGDWPKGYTHMDNHGVMWSGNFKEWIQLRQTL